MRKASRDAWTASLYDRGHDHRDWGFISVLQRQYRVLGYHWLDTVMAMAVFLLPAIALVAPTGYSWGASLLLIGAVTVFFTRRSLRQAWQPLPLGLKILIGFMLAYAAIWIGDAAWRGEGVREFDRPSRFLFAALCLVALSQCRLSQAWLWAGLCVGGIVTGYVAVWQKFIEGMTRASGTAQTIQFGNIAMMIGLMCLAGLIWAGAQRHRKLWISLLLIGAMGGVLASFLSGTRGAWLAPLAALPIGLWAAARLGHKKRICVLLPLVVVIFYMSIYFIPETGVKSRVDTAAAEVRDYFVNDDRGGSVGYRFEMWRGGWILFSESPVIGWGENAYIERLRALGEEGVIAKGASRFTHGHNEWINVLAKRGMIGGLILFGVYLAPLIWFARHGRAQAGQLVHSNRLGLAVAGMLLPASFFVGGLTQVGFNHNSGAMMYAFMLAVLAGLSAQTDYAK